MLFSTEETALFRQEMIDPKKMDVDEFIAANMMLKNVGKNKPELSSERMEMLWERIAADRKTRQRKRKKILLYGLMLAAACFAGLLVFPVSKQAINMEQEINYAAYQVINRQQTPDDILIVTDRQQMKIEGDNPEVSYDPAGTLSVNNQMHKTEEPANNRIAEAALNRICVPFGKRAQLKLADGTMLWINTGTTVVYPSVFSGEKREIYVDGEIYAVVKPDAGKPFTVKTEELEICVYGTEFDLSAYGKDESEQVVLVNGSVEVKQNGSSLKMNPGQLFTVAENGNSLKTVDTEIYTSWRDGIYIFEDEAIETILLKLSRYYNVTMELPQRPSGIVCFGKLELKDELPALLNALSQIASFNFAVKDSQYRIQFNE
jgi:ferric-dicitrate binding protein FerR (iron transport regulator)